VKKKNFYGSSSAALTPQSSKRKMNGKIANYPINAQHKLAPLSNSKLHVNRILIISDTGTLLICLPG